MKSRKCESAHCVDVQYDLASEMIIVTDTKSGCALTFTKEEWIAFEQGVKAGEFDDLVGE
jgi:hypothetical protein